NHREEHGDGLLRPRAHGNGLSADELRRVDDEDVGVVEVLVERLPGPLEKQGVADGQHGLLRTLVLTSALYGHDDEVAAGGDHARDPGLPDQAGSGWDDDLGETRRTVEQHVHDLAAGILRPEGQDLLGGQTGRGFRVPSHDEDVTDSERGPPQRAAPIPSLY